jgi:hypothetical protein
MSATAQASANAANPHPEELQAAALWTYVHLKVPRFTSERALDVVRSLTIRPEEDDVKSLATRLQRAMSRQGVAMKRTYAIEAAARLLGHENWHTANRAAPQNALALEVMGAKGQHDFKSWQDLAPVVLDYAREWLKQAQPKWPVFRLQHVPGFLTICAGAARPVTPYDTVPLMSVRPLGSGKAWLEGAAAAFETVRRGLEETGLAVLDGFTVLQLCGRFSAEELAALPQLPRPIDTRDTCDSELVLMQGDNEVYPGDGFEIARGDELNCWYQLDLALRDKGPTEIAVNEHGTWLAAGMRFYWQMNTLQPAQFAPMLTTTVLDERASEKLFRRYKLAKRTFSNSLRHPETPKRLTYLAGPGSTYHVDQHRIMVALERAGLTWESFCQAEGFDQPPANEVPVGFLMQLVERLKPQNPNVFFMRPNRSQMVRADDDSILRSLAPRTDHVTFRAPRDLAPEVKEAVNSAVEEFASSQHVRRLSEMGVVESERPLPYLVYAGDGEELRLSLEAQGLVMYVGVMPWLMPIDKEKVKLPEPSWSYAMGHQLYLDIDYAERSAQ